MALTYDPIATTTLSGAASSITFSSIPSTYTDLKVVVFANSGSTDGQIGLQFNGSTSNYSVTTLYGNGGSSGLTNYSTGIASLYVGYTLASTTTFTSAVADIFNYASSSVYKNVLANSSENQPGGSGFVRRRAGTWASTSAITSLSVITLAVNFAVGTRATLFGIKAA